MNTLILTRGVPGCGKSTWTKNNFEGYIICPDDIRLMYCAPEMKVDSTFGISQKADKYVWEFVFKVLEQRMKLGCLTVIDATHTKESAINAYKKLCEKYNYICYVKDFSEVPLDVCLERNANREPAYKEVPEEVIKRMHQNLMNSKIPSWCKRYIGKDYLYSNIYLDTDKYKEAFIFGDIHGCYNPLEKFFNEHPYSKDNLYVFVGDYLDRGIQNKEVLEFLIKHTDDENMVLLEGNHERCLDFYSKDFISDIKSKQFLEYTMKEISGISKEDIKKFISKLKPMCRFYFNKHFFVVTHGGLPTDMKDDAYSKQLISGVGEYKDSQLVDENWSKNISFYYSIHGHRNVDNVPMHNTDLTYNLCDKVEKGGYLRVLHLVGDNIKELTYKNDLPALQNITDTLYESLKPSVSKSCDEYFSKLSK